MKAERILRQDMNIPPRVAVRRSGTVMELYPHSELSCDRTRNNKVTGLDLTKTVENTATVGARLAYNYSYGSWSVCDPRGWTALISNGVADLFLSRGTINCGMIEDPIVWCRLGKGKTMDPVSIYWPEYRTIREFSENIYAPADTVPVSIGDRVVLRNGVKGIYQGRMVLYGPVTQELGRNRDQYTLAPQLYGRRHVTLTDAGTLFNSHTRAVINVTPMKAGLAIEQVVDQLNQGTMLDKMTTLASTTRFFWLKGRGRVTRVSTQLKTPTICLVPLDSVATASIISSQTIPAGTMIHTSSQTFYVPFEVKVVIKPDRTLNTLSSGYSGLLDQDSHSLITAGSVVNVEKLTVKCAYQLPVKFDLNDPSFTIYTVMQSIDGVVY